MNRRTSGASLLYSTSPSRWFRTAATIVDAWGSSLCALQWHASRALRNRAAMTQGVIGAPLMSPPGMDRPELGAVAGRRAPVRVRHERE